MLSCSSSAFCILHPIVKLATITYNKEIIYLCLMCSDNGQQLIVLQESTNSTIAEQIRAPSHFVVLEEISNFWCEHLHWVCPQQITKLNKISVMRYMHCEGKKHRAARYSWYISEVDKHTTWVRSVVAHGTCQYWLCRQSVCCLARYNHYCHSYRLNFRRDTTMNA